MFCFQHFPTKEFLWSDVCYLADQGATPLSLCQVIAATPIQVAQLANRELPIRFAKRIRQIEAPDGCKMKSMFEDRPKTPQTNLLLENI